MSNTLLNIASMRKYFAYGTNMNPRGMAIRCPTAQALGQGKVKGWRLIINTDGLPSIVPCPSATLYGALWKLTQSDESALDLYEGIANSLYTKKEMLVTTSDEQNLPVLVYIAANSTEGHCTEKEILQDILCGAEQFDFPEGYIKHLR